MNKKKYEKIMSVEELLILMWGILKEKQWK